MGISQTKLDQEIEDIHYADYRVKKVKSGKVNDKSPKRSSYKRKYRPRDVIPVQSTKEEEHEPSMEIESSAISDSMFEASRKVDKNIWSAAEQLMEAMTSMKLRPTRFKPSIELDESRSSTNSASLDSKTRIITIPASSLAGPEMHGKGLLISPMNSAKHSPANSAKNSFRRFSFNNTGSPPSPVLTPSISRKGSKMTTSMPTIQSALNFGEYQLDGDDDYCLDYTTHTM